MNKTKLFLIISVLLVLLSFSSCEIAYNKTVKQGKVWFIGYGADFGHDYSSEDRKGSDLVYTIRDTIETGKAFEALAKKTGTSFESAYFLGNYQGDLSGKSNVYDCSWDTYSNKVSDILNGSKDEDIIIFFFSSHGTGKVNKEGYGNDFSFTKNSILFYEPNTYGVNMQYESVTFEQVYDLIDGFKGSKLILCDTCFSGSFIVGDGVTVNTDVYKNKLPASLLFDVDINQSLSVWSITACTLNQESTEVQAFKHGGFTYFLLKGLGWNEETEKIETVKAKNGKYLTAGSLASYIYNNGGNYKYRPSTQTFGEGNAQTPVFSGGSSDIILFKF